MRSPRVDDGSAPRSASAPPWHIRARRPCRQRPLALRTRIWPASPMGRTRPPTPATCPPGSAWIPQWRSSCRCSAPASRSRNPPTPCPRHRPTAPASGPGPSARRPSAGVRKSPVPPSRAFSSSGRAWMCRDSSGLAIMLLFSCSGCKVHYSSSDSLR